MRWVALAVLAGAHACLAATDGIRFEGSQNFSARNFEHALRRYDISLVVPVDPTNADDAAFFLREFLFQSGYPNADVTYAMEPGGKVTFTISEGERFRLGRLDIEGAGQIDHQKISDIFTAAVRQVTLTPFGRLRFVDVAVEEGVNRITSTYVREGFLDAHVDYETIPEGNVVNVRLSITEGLQYLVGKVNITTSAPEVPREARDVANQFAGRIYRPGDEIICKTRMLDVLRNAGYFEAQVDVESADRTGDQEVSISLTVEPGAQYQMGDIFIKGNRFTRTRAISKRIGIKPGAPYNAARLDEGIRRLWFSSAFSDISTRQKATKDKKVDVEVNVEETNARQITGTLGYGEWKRGFGELTFTDRNFLGTLNRLSLTGFISQKGYGGEAIYSVPWMFNINATGTLGAFAVRAELPAFKATQIGATVGIERKFSETNASGWWLDYQWKAVLNSEVFAESADDGAPLNYTLGELSYRYVIDKRNDMLSPMQGWYLRGDAGVASRFLGGEISYGRLGGQGTWYQPFRKITKERPFVPFFIQNARVGMMLPYADTDEVPVQERYFLGGPDTVRSFQLDGMAPRDSDGSPEGGLAFFVTNSELQVPVWNGLYLAGFMDVGNLAPTLEEFTWDDTRIGVGLGGRFYTPLGAIRVDYGYNLIRKDGDPVGAWQFGFGFTF